MGSNDLSTGYAASHFDQQPDRRYRRYLSRLWRKEGGPGSGGGHTAGITRRAAIIAGVAAVSLTADYPDYSPHVATAAQIAGTGVPLLHAKNLMDSAAAIPVGPNITRIGPLAPVTQTSYLVKILLTIPNTATVPFAEVILSWVDSASGIQLAADSFIVPASSSGQQFVTSGWGPVKADSVLIEVHNFDPAQVLTASYQLYQTSRVVTRDEWRWVNRLDANAIVPGFSLPTFVDDESVLGILNAVTIPAATNSSWLFGMAPGANVQFAGNAVGVTPGSISMTVFAAPGSVYTGGGILLHDVLTTSGFGFQFAAPRAPLLATIANNATSGTLTMSGMMTAQTT